MAPTLTMDYVDAWLPKPLAEYLSRDSANPLFVRDYSREGMPVNFDCQDALMAFLDYAAGPTDSRDPSAYQLIVLNGTGDGLSTLSQVIPGKYHEPVLHLEKGSAYVLEGDYCMELPTEETTVHEFKIALLAHEIAKRDRFYASQPPEDQVDGVNALSLYLNNVVLMLPGISPDYRRRDSSMWGDKANTTFAEIGYGDQGGFSNVFLSFTPGCLERLIDSTADDVGFDRAKFEQLMNERPRDYPEIAKLAFPIVREILKFGFNTQDLLS